MGHPVDCGPVLSSILLLNVANNSWRDSEKQCTPIVSHKSIRRTRASHLSKCSTSKRLWHEFSKINLYVALTLPRWKFLWCSWNTHLLLVMRNATFVKSLSKACQKGIAWFSIKSISNQMSCLYLFYQAVSRWGKHSQYNWGTLFRAIIAPIVLCVMYITTCSMLLVIKIYFEGKKNHYFILFHQSNWRLSI